MVKVKTDQNAEERILAAAREVFLEKGIDGARMQDIADRAGINKALLHYYFRNKEKLFETVVTGAAVAFMPRLATLMATDKLLFEKIETFVREYIDMLIKNPYLPLFIMNEINRQPEAFFQKMWGSKRPPLDKLISQIDEEVKSGNIKPIHPMNLVMNMVSMCVFPFIARPMVQWISKMSDKQFNQIMELRKTAVATFIIDSIRK